MRAGRLRQRINLQINSPGERDEDGYLIPGTAGWITKATVSAAVEPLSGREFVAAAATQSEVTARITIRYRDDVTPAMRIVHRERIYNIQGILPDKDSGLEYLTLPCSEGVNEG